MLPDERIGVGTNRGTPLIFFFYLVQTNCNGSKANSLIISDKINHLATEFIQKQIKIDVIWTSG